MREGEYEREMTKRDDRAMAPLWETADGLMTVDTHGKILEWDESAEKMFGWKASDVIGRGCYEVIGGRDASGNLVCFPGCQVRAMAARREKPCHREVMATHADGRDLWLDVSIVLLRDPDGSLLGVVHLFRDVTARRLTEEHLQRTVYESWHQSHQEPKSLALLTAREREVLSLLASGLSTRSIAQKLSISLATVRNHSQNILSKLGVHSIRTAVALAHPELRAVAEGRRERRSNPG